MNIDQMPPFIQKDEGGYSGFCIDLINEIARQLNFQYEIIEEAKFGTLTRDRGWSGVVGRLVNRSADIGLGDMSVMAEREAVVDFTVPFYDVVGISILMKHSGKSQWAHFIEILNKEVWLRICGLVMITR